MQDPHSLWQNNKRCYKTIREVMCLFHTEVVLGSPQPVYSSSISRINHRITSSPSHNNNNLVFSHIQQPGEPHQHAETPLCSE